MITSSRTNFPLNQGIAHTLAAGSTSPVGTSGGWRVDDGSGWVSYPEAKAVAISGESLLFLLVRICVYLSENTDLHVLARLLHSAGLKSVASAAT